MGEQQRYNPTVVVAGTVVLGLIMIWIVLGAFGTSVDQQSNVFDVLSKIATIAAIVIGGYWTFTLYVKERTDRASLDVDQQVVAFPLPDGRTLLKVMATIKNISKVAAKVVTWRIYASQILPLDDGVRESLATSTAFPERRARWLAVAGSEDGTFSGEDVDLLIEPGQTERQIANLIVPADAEVVQVYSLFTLSQDPTDRGSPARTLVDLRVLRGGNHDVQNQAGRGIEVQPSRAVGATQYDAQTERAAGAPGGASRKERSRSRSRP